MYVCTCVYMYAVCTCVYMYAHVYICIYAYTICAHLTESIAPWRKRCRLHAPATIANNKSSHTRAVCVMPYKYYSITVRNQIDVYVNLLEHKCYSTTVYKSNRCVYMYKYTEEVRCVALATMTNNQSSPTRACVMPYTLLNYITKSNRCAHTSIGTHILLNYSTQIQ